MRTDKLHPEKSRKGFTLVELLVVIGVIGFMAGMVTYALLGAQTDARASRTRSTIQKLNETILQQWEEYRYRAIDVRMGTYRPNMSVLPQPVPPQLLRPSPRTSSHLRMVVLRDTMRMEMPDCAGDLLFGPSQYVVPKNFPTAVTGVNQEGSYLGVRAYSLRFGTLYRLLYQALVNSKHPDVIQAKQNFPLLHPDSLPSTETRLGPAIPHSPAQLSNADVANWIAAWDSIIDPSECLYLIVSTANFGGAPALEMFRPSEIGDPDNDGLLEFIDAWGKPIQWMRWPAGYPSDLNRYANTDAMDPLRTDWRFTDGAFDETTRPQTLVPLIVSPGPDERHGTTFHFRYPVVYARMTQGSGNNQFYVDPFFTWDFQNNTANGPGAKPPYKVSDANDTLGLGYRGNQRGSIFASLADVAADDITNHDLILEP